ncbi:hypothetical protein ACFLYO_10425, partial [Chloroflexota bacterium]
MLIRHQKSLYLILLVTAVLLSSLVLGPLAAGSTFLQPVVYAQWNPTAWTTGLAYLRQGPDMAEPIVSGLAMGAALMLEGRSADNTWVLGHTFENAARGWVQLADLVL